MEPELEAMEKNISDAREQLKGLFIFSVKTRWQFNPYDEPQEAPLMIEKKLTDKSQSFMEVQSKLHDKKLYKSESDNWWEYVNSVNDTFSKMKKLLNIIDIEWGKRELYFRNARLEEAGKLTSISPAIEKMTKTLEKHDDIILGKAVSIKELNDKIKELETLMADHKKVYDELFSKPKADEAVPGPAA